MGRHDSRSRRRCHRRRRPRTVTEPAEALAALLARSRYAHSMTKVGRITILAILVLLALVLVFTLR
jgi:hypothetical protein